jgi:hypothetical protein
MNDFDTEPDTPAPYDPHQLFAALENAPITTARTIMKRRGFEPVEPEAIPPIDLKGYLWELLYALAAHRCFFEFTNGMSDEALYQHLDEWLDHDFEDIPLSFQMNCHHDCSLALGYEEAFEDTEDPEDCLDLEGPAPVSDRDRFLPHPPWPRAKAAAKSEPTDATECPAEEALSVMEADDPGSAIAWLRPGAALQREEFDPPSPERLPPGRLRAALWELLHQLAVRGTFVTDTNHLPDAGLYGALWWKVLGGSGSLPPARDLRSRVIVSFRDCPAEVGTAPVSRDWRLPRPPF